MTWNASDLLRTNKGRADESPVPSRETSTAAAPISAQAPLVLDDAGIPMLPTVAAGLSWGEQDDTGDERWPQDMERELQAEGFVSPREWALWAKMCRRGVVEQ